MCWYRFNQYTRPVHKMSSWLFSDCRKEKNHFILSCYNHPLVLIYQRRLMKQYRSTVIIRSVFLLYFKPFQAGGKREVSLYLIGLLMLSTVLLHAKQTLPHSKELNICPPLCECLSGLREGWTSGSDESERETPIVPWCWQILHRKTDIRGFLWKYLFHLRISCLTSNPALISPALLFICS